MSLGAPGGNGRTSRIGLLGYPWAEATPANETQLNANNNWRKRHLAVIGNSWRGFYGIPVTRYE
jgi:hypothetical protein